jgi:hypothetical protein
MALEDFGALLRSGAASVPDYATQEAQRQLMMLKKQELGLQAAQFAQKLQQKHAFDTDVAGVLADPNPTNISALMLKHPEFADQVKGAWDIKDKAVRDADLTQLSEIYSAANAGKWDIAAQTARARLDADKAAGHADAGDEQIVNALESGTPEERKAALGMIGVNLAAATGAEHFGTVYNAMKPDLMAVGPGVDVIDKNNPQAGSVYSSPYRPQLWTNPTTGQTFQLVPNGSPAAKQGGAPAGAPAGSGFDNAVGFVLGHEGGYNPSDRNGAPVNFGINQKANPDVDVKNLTADQAKQLYLDRYWTPSGAANLPPAMQTPYFDTYVLNPEKARTILKASGGDPMKFIQLRRIWLKTLEKSGKYDKAWTARTDALEQQLHSSGGGYYGNTGAAPTQTATVGGKTYYKVNGQWFDNPEGK